MTQSPENIHQLRYLQGYPDSLLVQIQQLLLQQKLAKTLRGRYPQAHQIKSPKALYDFTLEIKNQFMRKSAPLSKVIYDDKIKAVEHALGLHSQISRLHGGKLKAKNEIRVASVFKNAPEDFLRMIVVHELAHFKEKEHNKAFYKLCLHMEPDYYQLEFDMRLYLTCLEIEGNIY